MKEFKRSATDKVLFGVCGGLGEYFEIDSTIIRLLFIIFAFFGGAAIFVYIALLLLMPANKATMHESPIKEVVHGIFGRDDTSNMKSGNILGIFVALFGAYILLLNLNVFVGENYALVWSILFIAVGIMIFVNRKLTAYSLIWLFVLYIILSILFSTSIYSFLHINYMLPNMMMGGYGYY